MILTIRPTVWRVGSGSVVIVGFVSFLFTGTSDCHPLLIQYRYTSSDRSVVSRCVVHCCHTGSAINSGRADMDCFE